MAKKNEKKPLTTKQKQIRHRAAEVGLFAGMGISVVTPSIIMGCLNFQEWFGKSDGWRIGLGGTLAMAVVAFAIAIITIKKEKELNLSNGWIILIVIWVAFAAIVKLLENIYHEIFTLMIWTAAGLVGAFACDVAAMKQKEQADAYKEARKKAKKETIEEKAKREVEEEEKRIKIKIVK